MKIGDYVRTNNGLIFKIIGGNEDNWQIDILYSTLEFFEDTWLELYQYNDNGGWFVKKNCKHSSNIIDLIEPMDLMFVDIDNGYEGGIIVPRIAETQNELKNYIDNFKNNTYQLKGIITHEQIENMEYRIGE